MAELSEEIKKAVELSAELFKITNERLTLIEDRLERLEERVQGIAEVNRLWDGS